MIKIGMMVGDRYEILEKIGSGGMSDVYKAKCHKLNRYVAIKVLKQEFSENTNFVSKFRVEAQAAAGLMHPNIVNVYDVGEEDGIHYIVMELVEGITLKNYIEKKARLSMKEAISIAIQVSMGIEAAHNNHIIHRDIKPQNIMISKEGKVKIADFGIAKAATSNTITSNVMGSVHYTSPEQARGGFSDERSDIYSLGCTMFEMLTGRVPFDGETTVAIAIKHIQEDMPSPREYVSEIPVCVEKIIFKCTQKSPDRRYQSMSELIADLKQSLITPEEDFVKIIDADTGGATRVISEEDIREIKQNTDRIDLGNQMRLKDREVSKVTSQEINEMLEEAAREEEEPADDYEDELALEEQRILEKRLKKKEAAKREPVKKEPVKKKAIMDPDSDEEYDNDDDAKMEKITTIAAIVGAVIVATLLLILIGKATGVIGGDKKKVVEEEPEITDEYEEETSQEELVTMINVVGMDLDEAKKALNDIGLGTKVTKQESDEYELNQVIEQQSQGKTISEGDEIAMYSTIDLVVSSGSNGVDVADVLGQDEAAAKVALESAGFTVNVESQHSSNVDAGKVISQEPAAGSKAEKNAKITIYVSSGPEVKKVQVPDLRGMTESAAKEKLQEKGLKCGKVTEVNSDTVTSGCVVSQSMNPNSEVEEATSVDIQLSIGPEKHTYKYVTNLDAPTGYVGGDVTITIKAKDGDTRTFTTSSFPCAVNEKGFKENSGTITYTYKQKKKEQVLDSETGEERTEETEQEVTLGPASVTFAQE